MKIKEEKIDKKSKNQVEEVKIASILSDDQKTKEVKKKTISELKSKAKSILKDITEATAYARFLKISPKKIRLVIDLVRGEDVAKALEILQFTKKKASFFVIKLLNSAIANAENNFKLNKDNLYIKKIVANEGPTLNRWRARAFGRAAEIKKKSTHIEIIVALKEDGESKKQKIKPSTLLKPGKSKNQIIKKTRSLEKPSVKFKAGKKALASKKEDKIAKKKEQKSSFAKAGFPVKTSEDKPKDKESIL